AFIQFRQDKRGLISKSIEHVVRQNRILGNTIDSLAVIATVTSIATSHGLGILQMNAGRKSVLRLPRSIWVQIIIAAIMLFTYLLSSSTGLNKGIKWLSNLNLGLCLALLVYVFFYGPTVFILNSFVLGLGDYLSNFIQYSLRLTPYQGGTWVKDWTIF